MKQFPWWIALAALAGAGCEKRQIEPSGECRTGEPGCGCSAGQEGSDCATCSFGYRPALSGGGCVPTCDADEISCGHGTCRDAAGGAVCECEPGYGGAGCDRCDEPHRENATGDCVAELPSAALLTLAERGDQLYLGALVPPRWSFRVLLALDVALDDVAYDPTEDVVYALRDGAPVRVDRDSGAIDLIETENNPPARALALDPAGQRLFTGGNDGVTAVDLVSGEVAPFSTTPVQALTFDASRAALLGVDASGDTIELYADDTVTRDAAPLPGPLGMAFDSSTGRAYFAGGSPESDDARLLRYCRGVLDRFGAVPGWRSQIVVDVDAGATARRLDIEYMAKDAALLAFHAGLSTASSLRVDVRHPDSAVCVVDDASGAASVLDVEVADTTRARWIVVVSPRTDVDLTLHATPASFGSSVVVHTAERLTVSGPSEGVSEHSAEAWQSLGLGDLADLERRTDPTLVLLDWSSRASLAFELDAPQLRGGLAWTGDE